MLPEGLHGHVRKVGESRRILPDEPLHETVVLADLVSRRNQVREPLDVLLPTAHLQRTLRPNLLRNGGVVEEPLLHHLVFLVRLGRPVVGDRLRHLLVGLGDLELQLLKRSHVLRLDLGVVVLHLGICTAGIALKADLRVLRKTRGIRLQFLRHLRDGRAQAVGVSLGAHLLRHCDSPLRALLHGGEPLLLRHPDGLTDAVLVGEHRGRGAVSKRSEVKSLKARVVTILDRGIDRLIGGERSDLA